MNAVNIEGLDLNLLKVFETLYEERNASRAAIRLNLTQSAVSAALGRIRTLYQDAIFIRTGRGLTPTARADEIKPIIGAALERTRHSLAITMAESDDYQGRTISVGLSDDFEIAFARRLMTMVSTRRTWATSDF